MPRPLSVVTEETVAMRRDRKARKRITLTRMYDHRLERLLRGSEETGPSARDQRLIQRLLDRKAAL